MNCLPLEVVTDIFVLTQEDDMEEWYDKRLVSPGWKEVIDGCPKLWRRVDLAAGFKFVGKQMERASGLPLWVQTDVSQCEPFGAAWIVAYSDVIEQLTLYVRSDQKHDGLEVVKDIFEIVQFPLLRRLTIRREGRSGDQTVSLPIFPAELVDPSALTHIELTNVSYPASALAYNTSLRVLRLDNSSSASTIALGDLRNVLAALPLLVDLTLGGKLAVNRDDLKLPPTTLATLTEFAFFGSMKCLDHLFAAFLLPGVESWKFRLRVGRAGISSASRLRTVMRTCAALPSKIDMRWVSSTGSRVQLLGGDYPRSFALQLSARHSSPCEILSDLLVGVESLPSVTQLHLHGGSDFLEVGEPRDEEVERFLVAARSVERVVFHGNGNSWVRVPDVLRRRLAMGMNIWEKIVTVEFGRGVALPYVVRVWLTLFWRLQWRGTPLRVLRLQGWMLQTASTWEFRTLAEQLGQVAETVEGDLDHDEYQVTF